MMILYIILFVIIFVSLVYLLGQYTFWLPHRSWNIPRILMLHQVTAAEPASGMNIQPKKFEQLLQLLQKKNIKTLTMSEWMEYSQSQKSSHQKVVALTFDDGFLDNYTDAFPLLEKYQAKATIFLSPKLDAIAKMQPEHLTIMSKSGLIEFGAHTMTHPNLNNISDEQAIQEIRASKQWVEEQIGYCHHFAYPFGRFSAKHMDMVKAAGFLSAVSTKKSIQSLSAENQYCLPRISVSGKMNMMQLKIAIRVGRYRL
ncbi:MAG: polysaccharide deacetylase family protein [Gammaproteobacteria bacterium]|nr:polysaccharide deacetylase family protein [Gammaproteobacteria bacterium]